jgi:hypothetical protein
MKGSDPCTALHRRGECTIGGLVDDRLLDEFRRIVGPDAVLTELGIALTCTKRPFISPIVTR